MNKYISRLIELDEMIAGRLKKDLGFVIFERLPKEEISKVPEEELAFATRAMGRAVFTLSKDGKITNYKGVDSHLENEESSTMTLVDGKAEYYTRDSSDYRTSNYPVNLVAFLGKRPDIRIRGASPLEDLEIEADINFRMQGKGIKLPKIHKINEFSEEFAEKYGLPIKIPGSFDEFISDYQEENDQIKDNVRKAYGDNYNEVRIDGKRPETLGEYFKRIGITNDKKISDFIQQNGFTMEQFIDYVDSSYSLGQRYGQAIRSVESPFRIADIEFYKNEKNVEVLENIANFTESLNPDRVPFENYFARQMGLNVANMMNNGWSCENFGHRQDYTLAGEMCDDSYVYVPDRLKHAEKYMDTNPGRANVEKSDIRLKFFLQPHLLSSTIKVLQEEMKLRGKSEKEVQSVLDDYLDSLTQNLDLEKVSGYFSKDTTIAKKALELLIRTPKNFENLLAFKPQEPSKPQINNEVLFAHRESNAFFDSVSQGLSKRLEIDRTFINETRSDIKGVNTYDFLEDR